jgi:hypothetical protein
MQKEAIGNLQTEQGEELSVTADCQRDTEVALLGASSSTSRRGREKKVGTPLRGDSARIRRRDDKSIAPLFLS